ncbi:BZ3500_MvSof-1268-A1-R1_Chr1-3g02345 [Microbotryum saponariae]|uniref:BZ3500_MvSof-1268-A1-R1_Chr1-3g02345 protein n=1 Tax=Microbotryum saponariae TaxID=289078 RepID=A0A2X0KW47_9BASI|nr:BZ3500_MvSof-1268-A1-R1_Chr1-3g02345 [Microbotryum saponariae]SCZ96056.1 BZ3501_MvSof-1269-A2-R1_Chr1-3g01948 [Microbotryum saponariae]
MFFNSDMLTKRGPLARVWMASHLSAKLSKTNLLATSIPSSVKSILGNDDTLNLPSMALRLSGQLLLGVARIYSRQTKYLLDDCNETLIKVKNAFRPGAVDMHENDTAQRGINAAAITLGMHEGGLEDILNQQNFLGQQWDLDFNARSATAAPTTTSGNKAKTLRASTMNAADINLPDHSLAWGEDHGIVDFDFGEGGGLESQIEGFFDEDFELGIMDDGNPRSDGDLSVEVGRDAAVHASDRGSIGPFDLDDLNLDKVPQFEREGTGGIEQDFEPWRDNNDFNLEFGGDNRETTPIANGDLENNDLSLTPKTLADLKGKAAAAAAKGAKKARKQLMDASIELAQGNGRSRHLKEPSYLPRSRLHLRLLELERDVTTNLPSSVSDATELFAPTGFAPELKGLYEMPTRRELIRIEGRASSAVPDEVELGRKRQASLAFSAADKDAYAPFDDLEFGGGEDQGGMDLAMEFDTSRDDFRFDLDDNAAAPAKDSNRTPRASPRKKQRVEEGESALDLADEDRTGSLSKGPLAVFDNASTGPVSAPTATQSQSLGATEEEEMLAANGKTKWSKNTVKAITVLNDELQGDDEATLEFSHVAQQVTKKAAASFFFELLVLSTRDCVKIEQPKSFGEIKVQAREKLWQVAAEVAAY